MTTGYVAGMSGVETTQAHTNKPVRRILLVGLGDSMGGVEAYLVGLAKILHGEAQVYALCVLPELARRLENCGVSVTRIPVFRRARILRYILGIINLCYLLLRYKIDVVQVNGFLESILLVPACLLGRESVYTRHGPLEMDLFKWYRQPMRYVPRFAARYGAHLASRIVCVSEAVGSVYEPMFPEGRVVVIPNWVTNIPPMRTLAKEPDAPLQMICVGRLEQYKGVHLLLEAIRGLDRVELTVVGDGAYRPQLEALAQGLNVKFVGFQSNVAAFYQSADVFVMPSLGPEGLPMVALEAMSHGLPCIFSDLPVHAEITDHGTAALLFRRGDAEDLRRKILDLLDSPAERSRLAENAYRMVEKKYYEPAAREAYLRVFKPAAA